MRQSVLTGVVLAATLLAATFLAGGRAIAADVTGVWMVTDHSAEIQIDNCGGALWGVVVWESSPGRDNANPNAALRGRPTLGMPVLLGLRPSTQQEGWQGSQPGVWRGHVYDAKNGETYDVSIRLTSPNVLHLEGCVLGGLFCGGQDWTRVNPGAKPVQISASTHRNPPPPGPVGSICSRLPGLAGRSH